MWNFSKITEEWLKPIFFNSFCRRFIMAILSCSATFAFAVNPVPSYLGRIAMCLQPTQNNAAAVNSPVIYNPFKIYGNTIYYSIYPDHEIMVVRVPGSSEQINLDLKGALQEAMMEWSAAIPGLTFIQQDYYGGNYKKWYFDINDDSPSKYKFADALRYRIGSTTNPTITFFSKGYGSVTVPEVYDVLSAKMAAPTMRKYLEFILRYTAKHEIGHMLGFEHTPDPDLEDPADTEECAAIVWLDNLPNVTPGPPLMIETVTQYFEVMRNYHDVPLTIEHINVAPQEAAHAQAMFNAECPVTPQMANNQTNTRSSVNYSNISTCPTPVRLVTKGEATRSLLLD